MRKVVVRTLPHIPVIQNFPFVLTLKHCIFEVILKTKISFFSEKFKKKGNKSGGYFSIFSSFHNWKKQPVLTWVITHHRKAVTVRKAAGWNQALRKTLVILIHYNDNLCQFWTKTDDFYTLEDMMSQFWCNLCFAAFRGLVDLKAKPNLGPIQCFCRM